MSNFAHRIVVTASAGTGKTFALVDNYLRSLFGIDGTGEKKRPNEILALTFTQKAANEMRLRITRQLSGLLSHNADEQPLRRMAREEGLTLPEPSEVQRILRAIPNAPIATFHGFCSSLLRKEARFLKMEDNFEILSPREEWVFAKNVLRSIIFDEIRSGNAIIKSLVARLRLKSGMVSLGLIDGLLGIYFKLSEKGIDCFDLLSLTRAEKTKISDLEANINRLESAISSFLRAPVTEKTRERLILIQESFSAFKQSLKTGQEFEQAREFVALRDSVKGNFGDHGLRRSLVSAVVALGAKIVDYYVFEDEMAVVLILSRFHETFDQLKAAANKLSYADLLTKTRHALLENITLRRRIKSQIRHVLVDEYQDTSPLQEDIIALLIENKIKESSYLRPKRIIDEIDISNGSSLFVVGDVKQSIYGFRGADASLMHHMINTLQKTPFLKESFARRSLNVNRRSSKKIIELVNLVARHAGILETESDPSELVANDSSEGICALWVTARLKDIDRSLCNLLGAVFGIVRLLNSRSDLSPRDIVVLVRRIKSASIIKEHLARFGVTARIIGGDGFFQQQEIVDILSLLKLINDPRDSLALGSVLRSPVVLLTDAEIFYLVSSTKEPLSLLSIGSILKTGTGDTALENRLAKFVDLLEMVRVALVSKNLIAALDVIINSTDFCYALGLSHHHDQKWANIEKLSAMFARETMDPFVAIDDYYSRISEDLKEPLATFATNDFSITIMTIHQSKGLEFNVVVLADGESTVAENYGEFLLDSNQGLGVVPKGRPISFCGPKDAHEKAMAETRFDRFKSQQKQKDLGEMKRLLYVALTRAKHELYIVSSSESYYDQDNKESLVGIFLRVKNEQEFLQICTVQVQDEPDSDDVPQITISQNVDQIIYFPKAEGKIRLFASSLRTTEQSNIQCMIPYNHEENQDIFNGNVAHKLIALAGEMMTTSSASTEELVDAAYRSLGLPFEPITLITIKKTIATLELLRAKNFFSNQTFFEMPLYSWPLPHLMIEGFADLVILQEDTVGLVEFKSSKRLAMSPDSYFQALAYAHALSLQHQKSVRFSVVLIGSVRPITWIDYDDFARLMFLDALKDQLKHKEDILLSSANVNANSPFFESIIT